MYSNEYPKICEALRKAGFVATSFQEVPIKCDELSDSYVQLENQYNSLLANYDALKNQYNQLEGQYSTLENQYNQLENQYNNLENQCNQLRDEYNNLESQYNALKSQYNELESQYNNLLTNYNQLKNQYNNLESQYNNLLNSFNSLKNLLSPKVTPLKFAALYWLLKGTTPPNFSISLSIGPCLSSSCDPAYNISTYDLLSPFSFRANRGNWLVFAGLATDHIHVVASNNAQPQYNVWHVYNSYNGLPTSISIWFASKATTNSFTLAPGQGAGDHAVWFTQACGPTLEVVIKEVDPPTITLEEALKAIGAGESWPG